MEILKVGTDSPWYIKSLELRNRELRIPLGLDLFAEPLEEEKNQIHFVLVEGNELLGVVVLVSNSAPDTCKLRQMAVEPSHRNLGLGALLIKALEKAAKDLGCKKITLHARAIAVGFYEKLDYRVASRPFTEVGIPHVSMEKTLS